MEIVFVMFLTIMKIVYYIIQTAVILGVLGVVLAVIGISGALYNSWRQGRSQKVDNDIRAEQQKYRNRKEASAHEDNFEESYVSGGDGAIRRSSRGYWREIDRLNDEKILENTREI